MPVVSPLSARGSGRSFGLILRDGFSIYRRMGKPETFGLKKRCLK
jgi:hypothetical protein